MSSTSGAGAIPRFTVVIPTYNRADVLGRAVRSVLEQTEKDLELVVVVDGATDGTPAVLDAVNDERLRVIVQPNAGVSNARNAGLHAARGALVTFLDDDDEADPPWIQQLGTCFDDPGCVVACCGIRRSGELNLPWGSTWSESAGLFKSGCFMARRDLLERVGGFLPGLAHSENTELGFRLVDAARAGGGHIARVDEILVTRHPELSGSAKAYRAEAVLQVIARHRDRFASDRPMWARWLAIAGVAWAREDDFPGARRLFLSAWRVRPIDARHLGRYALAWMPGLARRRWALPTRPTAVQDASRTTRS